MCSICACKCVCACVCETRCLRRQPFPLRRNNSVDNHAANEPAVIAVVPWQSCCSHRAPSSQTYTHGAHTHPRHRHTHTPKSEHLNLFIHDAKSLSIIIIIIVAYHFSPWSSLPGYIVFSSFPSYFFFWKCPTHQLLTLPLYVPVTYTAIVAQMVRASLTFSLSHHIFQCEQIQESH